MVKTKPHTFLILPYFHFTWKCQEMESKSDVDFSFFFFLCFSFVLFCFLQDKRRSEGGGLVIFNMVLHDSFPINFQRQNPKINAWYYGMGFDDDMMMI